MRSFQTWWRYSRRVDCCEHSHSSINLLCHILGKPQSSFGFGASITRVKNDVLITSSQFSAAIPRAVYALLGTSKQLNVAPEASLSLLIGQGVTAALHGDAHNIP